MYKIYIDIGKILCYTKNQSHERDATRKKHSIAVGLKMRHVQTAN